MLTKDHIQQTVAAYFVGKPVLRAYLFGSFVRNEADEKSDVDLLVEFDYQQTRVSFVHQHRMMEELAEKLHRKVDLISTTGMSPYIGPLIHAEKELLYERPQ